MKYKACLAILLFGLSISAYSQSQHRVFRQGILPKIQAKIYSLYPSATNLTLGDRSYVTDGAQIVMFRCNCQESSEPLVITVDTNGNILNKDIFISMKELPATIKSYIKTHTTHDTLFSDRVIKSITNKGEIFYSITRYKKPGDGPTCGMEYYILKFKKSGEFISGEKRFQNI